MMPKCQNCKEEMFRGFVYLGVPKINGSRMGQSCVQVWICPNIHNVRNHGYNMFIQCGKESSEIKQAHENKQIITIEI